MAGMVLRIPNPGSSLPRLINTFRLIHRESEGDSFDLDRFSRVLTDNFQASSQGAVGKEALSRSTRADRARDPLFNESKMYSEVLRMLGWIRPAGRKSEFRATFLGDLIADSDADPELTYGLVRECLLSVTFPNPLTNNIGVTNQRPFRWLLLLTAALGGKITGDEMVLGILNVIDDRSDGAFNSATAAVSSVRGSREDLCAALKAIADANKIQVNTLKNYTRVPVAVLKSPQIGWGTSRRMGGLYEKPVQTLCLTTAGAAAADRLQGAIDIREPDLAGYPLNARAAFANYAYFAMLLRAGLEEAEIERDLTYWADASSEIRSGLGVSDPYGLVYSPFQQADDELLTEAGSIEGPEE